MGVCAEIGHLSHMMSRGMGCIIDETKQPVSASTHHSAGEEGGSSIGGVETEMTTTHCEDALAK